MTQKISTDEKKSEKAKKKDSTIFSNDDLLNDMNNLFKNNKLQDLVERFETGILNKLKNGEEFRSIHAPLVSLYTNSLLILVFFF